MSVSTPISIIIPTYNRAKIIGRTIESFLLQTYTKWEMLVVDDFSSDDTKDVIVGYIKQDSRIKYLRNERKKGAQGARNTGILKAKFNWILLFDSDNVAHPNMLSELIGAIGEDVDVISCFSNVIDSKTYQQVSTFEWENEGNIHKRLFSWDCYVDFNQAIIRKEKLFEIGLLDEDCPSMQEWDTHIRLSNVARYHTLHEHLLDYYIGASDAISSNYKREVNGRIFVFNKHKDEWKSDKYALNWILINTYSFIRKTDSIWFRFISIFKLMFISTHILPIIINYRWRHVKRKF